MVCKWVWLAVLMLLLGGCLTPDVIEKTELQSERLLRQGVLKQRTLTTDSLRMNYMVAGAGTGTWWLMIHGTPGDWSIFSRQLANADLANSVTLAALDRPGWGDTQTTVALDGSLAQQSALLGPALQQLKHEHDIKSLHLVGHSLGGSLVPLLAMDFPELADQVIVLAGDLTDQYPAARWYNHVAGSWLVNWMLPDALQRSNVEVLALPESLRAMASRWPQLATPMLVVQGMEDSLVDPRNAEFAKSLHTASTVKVVTLTDADHLFLLRQPKKTAEILRRNILGPR